ncbi:pentapeptide repeat-containing protein [Streptomyces sp. NPDC007983]|uniref:pentapeptide repeat-containing protein n=1 Tax=Streptomyces sp. NPDC007983 TaxID=3364800 RepID=UPI0036E8697B
MSESSQGHEPPPWPHCGIGADPEFNQVGCLGQKVEPFATCLPHLNPDEREAYFQGLEPGNSAIHRGTEISRSDLAKIVDSVRDGDTVSGSLIFTGATFRESVKFENLNFSGVIDFTKASFKDDVSFYVNTFTGETRFEGATFKQANFIMCTFVNRADFRGCTFEVSMFSQSKFSDVDFSNAHFGSMTSFDQVLIEGTATFFQADFNLHTSFANGKIRAIDLHQTTVSGNISFDNTELTGPGMGGTFVCQDFVSFDHTTFTERHHLNISAPAISYRGARFNDGFTIEARFARIDLTGAYIERPSSITAGELKLFSPPEGKLIEYEHLSENPQLASLQGVDASMLLLVDVDLRQCLFSGTHHLDQIQIEGDIRLDTTPDVWIYAKRRVIYEERRWRLQQRTPTGGDRWSSESHLWEADGFSNLLPKDIRSIESSYRQLRKAREDAKDEPGAADFYYGEMEMRRLSRKWGEVERWLLQAYWLVSGYGLRASRALSWLALAMMTTVLLMMGFGLPQDSPKQEATGIVPPSGGRVTFQIDKDDPINPTGNRFTSERFDKSLSVTLNSVVFRSGGQDLTTAGGYIEMASRFFEPVLLGLAALAIRGRIKR